MMFNECRVLDLTDEKGIFCTNALADLGAEVIRVESLNGSSLRNKTPFYHDERNSVTSLYYLLMCRNMKSITLNIEQSDGAEILRKLVAKSNIIVESFPPGYMRSLGLDYNNLSQLNPCLVYTSITPFGQEGPYSHFKDSDLVLMASGGLMYINGYSDRAPLRFSIDQAYYHGGIQGAAGTMLAYYWAEKTGQGQAIDVSIQEAVSLSHYDLIPLWYNQKKMLMRAGERVRRDPLVTKAVYQCQDGEIFWRLWTGFRGRWTSTLVHWMEENNMAGNLSEIDWTTVDYDSLSQEQLDEWEEVFSKFFLTKTKKELYRVACERNFLLYPQYTVNEVLESEQLLAREYWVKVNDASIDKTLLCQGLPFKSSIPLVKRTERPPRLGEHNEEIFSSVLGFSSTYIQELRSSGVV